MADDLSLVSLLQLAGIGGVTAAVANQGIKWAIDTVAERKRHALESAYTALRLIVILERFTSACVGHLRDRDVLQQMGKVSSAGQLPKLDDFPGDLDWRSFNQTLALQILGFPARIEAAQTACNRADWESEDYWMSEEEAIALGASAWLIALKVRNRYSFGPNKDLDGDYAFLASEDARRKSKSVAI